MLITKIEASNFLSFDEIAIDLTKGLNVVVGPNAAGKSNVILLVSLLGKALDRLNIYDHRALAFRKEETTYLRVGHDTGTLRVAVEFDSAQDDASKTSETELIKQFLLAFIASNVYARLNELQRDNAVENARIAFSEGRSWADRYPQDTLFSGTFLLIVNQNPSLGTRIGFEFDYNDHSYIYSLTDNRVFYDKQAFAIRGQSSTGLAPFQNGVTLLESGKSQVSLPFDRFLPARAAESYSWELANYSSGTGSEPWLAGLQGAFGFRVNQDRGYSLVEVLTHLYTTKLLTTENLRRPPRRYYPVSRLAQSRPISDAEEVPLRLLQMKDHSIHYYQDQFLAIQKLFNELTGYNFGVAASYLAAGENESPSEDSAVSEPQVVIDVFVREGEGRARIDRAGSGIWESLFLATLLNQGPGVVTFLDEPAVNMHPTLQRKVLAELKASNQTIITTHSPYLVPSGNPGDLDSIIRLYRSGGATKLWRVPNAANEGMSRSNQIHTQPEARSMLFASGVLLVEGDTDAGALHAWFNNTTITEDHGTLDGNNFQMVSVGGDKSFKGFVNYLEAFGIPWAIICDGPVMSPDYGNSLLKQLPVKTQDDRPGADAAFEDWTVYWESRGVFTVAGEFGVSTKTKNGEIEAFFKKMDADLWKCACAENPDSKVRQGSYFAQHLEFDTHSHELTTLQQIYGKAVCTLRQV
jgi:predicted ATPase